MPKRITLPADDVRELNRLLNKLITKRMTTKSKSTRKTKKKKTVFTQARRKALIKAFAKNKSMKPASRRKAIAKLRKGLR